jgi:hypothetical protein
MHFADEAEVCPGVTVGMVVFGGIRSVRCDAINMFIVDYHGISSVAERVPNERIYISILSPVIDPSQEGTESAEHFLFHCKQWDDIRQPMIHAMGGRFGDLSYALGGRSSRLDSEGKPIDGTAEAWTPNMEIVKVVLKFAIQTKRLTVEE